MKEVFLLMKLQVNPASTSGSLQANLTLFLVLLCFCKVCKYINTYPKQVGNDSSVN